jgi:hypothetical protein
MANIRYVVAMVRRDDPVKPGQPHIHRIRAEFPIERLTAFIEDCLSLPEKTGFLKSKKFTKQEVEAAFKMALGAGVSKAYSWLMNNRIADD